LHSKTSDRVEGVRAMLFWKIVVLLSVVGVLAIGWGIYLPFRRWL
jgi:hypothetical protein